MKRAMIAVVALQALLPFALHAQIANIVVTNAAGFQAGLPPRGSIGSIFCTGLTVKGVVSAPGSSLPTSLAGVSVTIGGVAAPLFAVADLGGYQQINFQVPLGAQIETQTAVAAVVISQGSFQESATVKLGFSLYPPVAVGAFFQIAGTPFGIFQHGSDNSLVTMDNPATAGETIIGYATGLPTALPAVPDGQPSPSSPLSSVPQPFVGNSDVAQLGLSINSDFSVSTSNWLPFSYVAGQPPILFVGLTPGTVGLFQINFVLPSGLPAGTATIAIGELTCVSAGFPICGRASAWGHTSGPAVFLPVR